VNEDVFVGAIEKYIFTVANLHDGSLQNNFLIPMQRHNSIVVFVAQKYMILILQLFQHLLRYDSSEIIPKFNLCVHVAQSENLNFLSQPIIYKLIMFRGGLKQFANLVYISRKRKLALNLLPFSMDCVRFESIINLKAVHERAPFDITIVVELWNQPMHMGLHLVKLAVVVEFSRREHVP